MEMQRQNLESPAEQLDEETLKQVTEDVRKQYRVLVDLWISENSVKTTKLQMLALVNSILFSGFVFVEEFPGKLAAILLGIAFSTFWLFSIGNTISHQKYWKHRIEELEQDFPQSFTVFSRLNKREFPIYGRIASAPILLTVPVFAIVAWLVALILLP